MGEGYIRDRQRISADVIWCIDQRMPARETAAEIYLSIIPIKSRFCYAMVKWSNMKRSGGEAIEYILHLYYNMLTVASNFFIFFIIHIPITK